MHFPSEAGEPLIDNNHDNPEGNHMGKVFFSVGMSLDGFIAPEGMDMAHIGLEIAEALHSPLVTHLRYTVTQK